MSKLNVFDASANNQSPSVTVSPAAIKHLQQQISKAGHGIGIRITIDKRGCNGYAYVLDIIDATEPEDHIVQTDAGLMLAIAPKALPFVLGTHIDFVREGLNEKFIYQNPNQTGSCGCGESFSVD